MPHAPFPDRPAHMATTDSTDGAAALLAHDWGTYGYRLGLVWSDGIGGGLFGCTYVPDGSDFYIWSDRYGNARQVGSWADIRKAV